MAIVLLLLLAFSYIGFFYTSCNVHCIHVRLIKYFAVFDILGLPGAAMMYLDRFRGHVCFLHFCHRSTSRLGN